MTRKEQMIKYANQVLHNEEEYYTFIKGVDWADENPIPPSYKEYIDARNEIIEETIAWMKTIVIQETANGYAERLISDNMIEEYKKVIGYEQN